VVLYCATCEHRYKYVEPAKIGEAEPRLPSIGFIEVDMRAFIPEDGLEDPFGETIITRDDFRPPKTKKLSAKYAILRQLIYGGAKTPLDPHRRDLEKREPWRTEIELEALAREELGDPLTDEDVDGYSYFEVQPIKGQGPLECRRCRTTYKVGLSALTNHAIRSLEMQPQGEIFVSRRGIEVRESCA